ncbi:recombinase family protein [Cryobacterium sp. TMT4-31]|nr:recombinase family protein [Cryobacterium sp. TMT4-31]
MGYETLGFRDAQPRPMRRPSTFFLVSWAGRGFDPQGSAAVRLGSVPACASLWEACGVSGRLHSKSVHDPNDPVGRLLFNVLAMVTEFESDLIRARTREGMQVAKAKGRLRGKQPKLSNTQQKLLVEVHNAGTHSTAEIAELFNVARLTVYRTVQRQLGTGR